MAYEAEGFSQRNRGRYPRGRGGYRGGRGRYGAGYDGSPRVESPVHGTSAPPPPPPRSPSMVVSSGWQYKDPEGDVHGPYLAAKIVNWVDGGIFSEGLPVRKVTPDGMGAWTLLKYVLIDIRREAALTVLPVQEQESMGQRNEQRSRSVAVKSPMAAATTPPPPPARAQPAVIKVAISPKQTEMANVTPSAQPEVAEVHVEKREVVVSDRGLDANPSHRQSDFGPRTGQMDNRERRGRGGRMAGRGDRWDRSGRGVNRYNERGRGDRGGRGRRGGRGGRGRGSDVDPDVVEAVHRLFTGNVEQGADQPMWRYIDFKGNMQGPFPAHSMEGWFAEGYLSDSTIPVCGTERKVSPPNLPPEEFFIPLGALIYWVRRGNNFKPITVTDIQSKQLPSELAVLKESAAKAVEGVAKEKETLVQKTVETENSVQTELKPATAAEDIQKFKSTDRSWAEEEEEEEHEARENHNDSPADGTDKSTDMNGTTEATVVDLEPVKSVDDLAAKVEQVALESPKPHEENKVEDSNCNADDGSETATGNG